MVSSVCLPTTRLCTADCGLILPRGTRRKSPLEQAGVTALISVPFIPQVVCHVPVPLLIQIRFEIHQVGYCIGITRRDKSIGPPFGSISLVLVVIDALYRMPLAPDASPLATRPATYEMCLCFRSLDDRDVAQHVDLRNP